MIHFDSNNIAFIGHGLLSDSVIRRLLAEGFQLTVYDSEAQEMQSLLEAGVQQAYSVEEAVSDAQLVITMLKTPEDVEDIYIGEAGIIDSALPDAYLIDMSTSTPRLAKELFAIAAVNDLHVLDAPIIGGDKAADIGALSFVVGGEKADFDTVSPLLDLLGTAVYQGACGRGQYTKLAHQIALAGTLLATVEMLAFAKQAGLDLERLLASFDDSSASSWTLYTIAPLIIRQNYSSDYFVSDFVNTLGIALAAADELDLTLPGLETAYQLYDLLTVIGGDGLGLQALALIYEDERTCAQYGLNWSLAERYDFDDLDDYDDGDARGDDCDDEECHHHRRGTLGRRSGFDGPVLGSFFSPN